MTFQILAYPISHYNTSVILCYYALTNPIYIDYYYSANDITVENTVTNAMLLYCYTVVCSSAEIYQHESWAYAVYIY